MLGTWRESCLPNEELLGASEEEVGVILVTLLAQPALGLCHVWIDGMQPRTS